MLLHSILILLCFSTIGDSTFNFFFVCVFVGALQLESGSAVMSHSLDDLGIGSFANLVTCTLATPLMDVLHQMFHNNISAVPVLDENGLCVVCV